MTERIRFLLAKYKLGGLDPDESVELVQFLIDTDLIQNIPEMLLISQRYIAEGLCYYVPDIGETN